MKALILSLLVALFIPFLGLRLYFLAYNKRLRQFASFPQLPISLALGHLALLDQFIKRGVQDRHPDNVFDEMRQTINNPPVTFFDLRPVNRALLLISDHEIAEQVSQPSAQFPTSIPKASLGHLSHIIGKRSILSASGDTWKGLRTRFNPGFAPQHLSTLLPLILDKTPLFTQHLERLAKTGDSFNLLEPLVNVTFDIIGAVVMDTDLQAQRPDGQGEVVRLFDELLSLYRDDKADLPWWIIPHIQWKRYRLGKRLHSMLEGVVRDKYIEYVWGRPRKDNLRSILALSFQDSPKLTPELISVTTDQIKTFLMAGHDTTSTALSWALYELHRTPRALDAVRKELDQALGPETDPAVISDKLRDPPSGAIINQLPYLSAVIKETLRMHPPAATARTAPKDSSFTIKMPDGKSLIADEAILYNCNSMVHRDPAVYGESRNVFVPERWLDSDQAAKVPAGAWRPFERGPRSCIGQHFANMELRVILALVVRRFEFTKVGLGALALDEKNRPILGEDGQYKVERELYGTRQITTKPVDGMRMKVQLVAGK